MLHKFRDGQRSVLSEILAALSGQDWSRAEILAHTLKGVCGNVGANGLQQLAALLEGAIKERRARPEIDARLEDLKAPLATLMAQLDQQLPGAQHKTIVTIDPVMLKEVCRQLELLLADDDAQASDVLEANSNLLCAAFPNHYSKIENAVRSFDFAAALTTLRAVIGTSA
jgi:two-component system sensor histidine kinase/response regulator